MRRQGRVVCELHMCVAVRNFFFKHDCKVEKMGKTKRAARKRGGGARPKGAEETKYGGLIRAMEHSEPRERAGACASIASLLNDGSTEYLQSTARELVDAGLLMSLVPRLLDNDVRVAVHAAGILRCVLCVPGDGQSEWVVLLSSSENRRSVGCTRVLLGENVCVSMQESLCGGRVCHHGAGRLV